MILVTWNTQGDFTASSKEQVIAGLGDATDVFCLQEGGVGKEWTKGFFDTFTGRSVGSKNERCTNYLLIKKTLIGDLKPEENRAQYDRRRRSGPVAVRGEARKDAVRVVALNGVEQ
jgi:hypothetical protein